MPDVFISYSRKNLPFVQQLVSALEAEGKSVWWDQKKEALEGIVVGSPWWGQIKLGIETADYFLFVISPNSIVSPYCHAEINHARLHGKRLVTALYCHWISEQDTWQAIGVAIDAIPAEAELPDEVTNKLLNFRSLVRQNWLSLNEIQHAVFTSSTTFEEPFGQLIKALDLDFAWVKAHNRLRQAALLWEESGRSNDFLWSHGQLKLIYQMIEQRKPELDPLVQDFVKPEQERLLAELEDLNTSHHRRSTIGERLAAIGDTRPGVGLRADDLPDIVWCPVPSGKVTLVDRKGTFYCQAFYIAKYPITYVQFQAFVRAHETGYYDHQWWQYLPPEFQMHKLAEQYYKFDNNPCDNISWYQAVAFCRWLTFKLPRDAWPSDEAVAKDWIIRLPTEWEWQQAACGGQKNYEFPWGKEWDERRANTTHTGIHRVMAVGMYPAGVSPVGALDMIGNLPQWCLNEYDNPKNFNIEHDAQHTLRGGLLAPTASQVTVRRRPGIFESGGPNNGFRVVVGAIPDEAVLLFDPLRWLMQR